MIGIDTPALIEKAHRKIMIGRYEDAIELYDDVLEQSPNNIRVMTAKAIALRGMGKRSYNIF